MSTYPNDVVEALVREYLVRAGCPTALEAFNREKVSNPVDFEAWHDFPSLYAD